jgi:hypothetical protein
MTVARDGDGVDAQVKYDADHALRKLLKRAALSPTVHRDRPDHAPTGNASTKAPNAPSTSTLT